MPELKPSFPWVYPYQEDGPRLGQVVLRPVVSVALVGPDGVGVLRPTPVMALVDSGCEHVLAAPWLADAAGVDPKSSDKTIVLGLGGDNLEVRFLDVKLRLYPPRSANDDVYVEWEDEVGFLTHWRPTWPVLLGQVGFMRRFTITMSRHSQCLAVDDREAFDDRYGVPLAP